MSTQSFYNTAYLTNSNIFQNYAVGSSPVIHNGYYPPIFNETEQAAFALNSTDVSGIMQNFMNNIASSLVKAASAPTALTLQQMSDAQLQALWNSGDRRPGLGDEIHRRNAAGDSSVYDPCEVNLDGKNYMFVRNNNADGQQDILGINDKKDNLFADMKSLDTNNDGKIDYEELIAAGVSLNEVNNNGQLTSNQYDLNKIAGVDLSSFKATGNNNATGIFGTFNLNLKDGNQAQGEESFEDQDFFNKLLA